MTFMMSSSLSFIWFYFHFLYLFHSSLSHPQIHEIHELDTFTQYVISIQVFNPEGIGPATNVVVMTDEGGKYIAFHHFHLLHFCTVYIYQDCFSYSVYILFFLLSEKCNILAMMKEWICLNENVLTFLTWHTWRKLAG